MFAVAGGPSYAGSPLTWSLLFARQPEPDLEFTEEELEQTTNVRGSSPMKSPKKSGGRPLLWILLLLLAGGGAYVAMEPEVVMDLLGPLLGESPVPPQPQPPVAMKPGPAAPAPAMPGVQPAPSGPASMAPPAPAPPSAAPPPPATPASVPAPAAPSASTPPTPPAPVNPPAPAAAMPPVTAAPSPMFAEGQKVTVVLNPAAPGDLVTLTQDPAGTKPGPAIRPGTTLTILDGDLQNSGWVYSVRSDDGTKGWIAENRLRLKP
jgi:hypothetical protein